MSNQEGNRVSFLGKYYYLFLILFFAFTSCGGEGSTVVGNPPATTVSNPKKITISAIKDGKAQATVPTDLFGSNGNLIDLAEIQVVVNNRLKEILNNLDQYFAEDRRFIQFDISDLVKGDVVVIVIVINQKATEAFQGEASEEEAVNGDLLDRSEIEPLLSDAEPVFVNVADQGNSNAPAEGDLDRFNPNDDIPADVGGVNVNVAVDAFFGLDTDLRSVSVFDLNQSIRGRITVSTSDIHGSSIQIQPYFPSGAFRFNYQLPLPDNLCRIAHWFDSLEQVFYDDQTIYTDGNYSVSLYKEPVGEDQLELISETNIDAITLAVGDIDQGLAESPHYLDISAADLSINRLDAAQGFPDSIFSVPQIDRAFSFTPLRTITFDSLPDAKVNALDVAWHSNRLEEIQMLTVEIVMTRSLNVNDGYVALSCHLDHDAGSLENIVNRREVLDYLISLDFEPSIFMYAVHKYQPYQLKAVDYLYDNNELSGNILFENSTYTKASYSNGIVELPQGANIDQFLVNEVFPLVYEDF